MVYLDIAEDRLVLVTRDGRGIVGHGRHDAIMQQDGPRGGKSQSLMARGRSREGGACR